MIDVIRVKLCFCGKRSTKIIQIKFFIIEVGKRYSNIKNYLVKYLDLDSFEEVL